MDTSFNAANQVVSVGADIAFDANPKYFFCLVSCESSSVPTALPTAYDVYLLDGRHDGDYYTVKDCVPIFFFQAEDGIRDHCVTGVQTCALPISSLRVDLGFASLKNCPKSLISSSAVWLSIVTTSSPTTKGNLLVGKAVRSIASIRTLQIGRASCRERV